MRRNSMRSVCMVLAGLIGVCLFQGELAPTIASAQNLRLIDQKKMELAVITPQIGYSARMGLAMFKDKKIDLYSLARLLPNANVWVVLDNSKVKSIPELKGHKVGVGPA